MDQSVRTFVQLDHRSERALTRSTFLDRSLLLSRLVTDCTGSVETNGRLFHFVGCSPSNSE